MLWQLCLNTLGRTCLCAWKRKAAPGPKDLPGYQLHWTVALLQVKTSGPFIDRPDQIKPAVWDRNMNSHWELFSLSGPTHSLWCTAMRWYQRALSASSTLTWSFISPPTNKLMGEVWCRHLSRWATCSMWDISAIVGSHWNSSDNINTAYVQNRIRLNLLVVCVSQYVCDKLMGLYGVQCSAKDVLNLDSSTEEKFSRHLIFNLQHAAFKDNTHVGELSSSSKFRFVPPFKSMFPK